MNVRSVGRRFFTDWVTRVPSNGHGLFPRHARCAARRHDRRAGEGLVGFDNRLTAAEIAALTPGDAVVFESGHEFNRPRYAIGTVIRVGMSHVDVCCDGHKGARYVERYRLRDGLREGKGRAELVQADAGHLAARGVAGRETRHIEALYRQWHRRPDDLEAVRELRDAMSEHLDELLVT